MQRITEIISDFSVYCIRKIAIFTNEFEGNPNTFILTRYVSSDDDHIFLMVNISEFLKTYFKTLLMERGYKYRIYPNKAQRELIAKTFGCCRFVYNHALDRRKTLYENKGMSESRVDINNWCNRDLKAQYEWLREVDKFALTNSIYDMDNAYKKFFREHVGYPKFKSKHDIRQSYKTNYSHNNIAVDFDENMIKLPKLGRIKAKIHRTFDGVIKNATVSCTPSGKYFVSICVNSELPEFNSTFGVIGLDLGIKDLCSCSDGTKFNSPNLTKLQSRLKHQQRSLSKKTKGSSNYKKQKVRLARLHERISNIRKDSLHKLSRSLVDENQVIVTESLNVKGMLRNHHLARSISNASWYELTRQLEYKSRWYGRKYIKIDTFYASSQTCNCCGHKEQKVKNLAVRSWTCSKWSVMHDRDVNAAVNILKEGLRQEGLEVYIGQELPEFKPVDRPTMDDRRICDLRSRAGMKQETHRL